MSCLEDMGVLEACIEEPIKIIFLNFNTGSAAVEESKFAKFRCTNRIQDIEIEMKVYPGKIIIISYTLSHDSMSYENTKDCKTKAILYNIVLSTS